MFEQHDFFQVQERLVQNQAFFVIIAQDVDIYQFGLGRGELDMIRVRELYDSARCEIPALELSDFIQAHGMFGNNIDMSLIQAWSLIGEGVEAVGIDMIFNRSLIFVFQDFVVGSLDLF